MLLKFLKNGSHKMTFPYIYTRFSLLPYTTSSTTTTNTSLMVNYLMKTLGFTQKEAITTSTKLPPLKSTQKLDSVVHFLKTTGFNNTHIKKLVFNIPNIVNFDIDKILRPKLDAFIDVGVVGSDLGAIVSQCDVLTRSLKGHIRPTLDVLTSVFGSGDDNGFVIRVLKSSSWMLASCVRANLPVSYSLLKSYGLSDEQIRMLFLKRARYMLDSKWVQSVLIRVDELIGIPRESGMFVHGVCALSVMSDESLKSRFKLFKSLGFSDDDIMTLSRKNPYALTKAESTLRWKVTVLMDQLGCKTGWIAGRPSILTFSFEKRVMPRYVVVSVLKEKGLMDPSYSLFSYLHLTDSRFIEKFLVPYKDKIPHLYDDFIRSVNLNVNVNEKVSQVR